jgi:hypothetical protein
MPSNQIAIEMMNCKSSNVAFANQILKRIALSFLTRNDAPWAPQEGFDV